jgi:hypothetical protein
MGDCVHADTKAGGKKGGKKGEKKKKAIVTILARCVLKGTGYA